jgi:alkylation response protein AidB-like acyl-CoA dehydrogenase
LKPWLELREIAAGYGAVLPKPGSGGTPTRFAALADWATRDLSLARLVEGHVDAIAVLAEANLEPNPGATYGVWAARPRVGGVTADPVAGGWRLAGSKPFCSGSTRIDRALVTAECDDGYRLFDLSVAENVVAVHPGSWPSVGMADSLSDTLEFGGPPVPTSLAVGPPNFYLERAGSGLGELESLLAGSAAPVASSSTCCEVSARIHRSSSSSNSDMPSPTSISCAG